MKPGRSEKSAEAQAGRLTTTEPEPAVRSGSEETTAPKDAEVSVSPAIDHPLERLLALGLMLGIVQFWLQRHLALSFLEEVKAAPLIAVLIPFLVTLLDFLAGKAPRKKFQNCLRRRAVVVLRTPVLGLLLALLVVAGSMVSSVTVLAAGTHDALPVTVRRESGVRTQVADANRGFPAAVRSVNLAATANEVRLLMLTNPFGAACVIEVEGYQPYSFDLYPWIGKRVRVDRDLEHAPSLLVRVPLGLHSQLPGGRLELWSADEKLAATDTADLRGSVLFGRELALDRGRLADWEHELRMSGAEGSALSRGYLAWRRPLVVPIKPALAAGMKLEGRFISRSGALQASAGFTLTRAPLQDVLLDVEKDQTP
jgi:hypothetical protein